MQWKDIKKAIREAEIPQNAYVEGFSVRPLLTEKGFAIYVDFMTSSTTPVTSCQIIKIKE